MSHEQSKHRTQGPTQGPTRAQPKGQATVAQLSQFDAIIDARSPAEFALDHVPGAINLPVLSNDERARVGTLYKQVSPFEARKLGASLVAKNIARHIERHMLDKPKDWTPLVYCWRGGQRSGAFTHILREIGWPACRLEDGYMSWRRYVVDRIEALPATLSFRVLTGATGSGKSRLLEALAAAGAQVLHLEQLARHKGSVLGVLPQQPQPAQKGFESALFAALAGFDPAQPVYVEAESRKIGQLHLPQALLDAMHGAPCLRIEADFAARVEFLLRDYDYFLTDRATLHERLDLLQGLQSNETLARWSGLIGTGRFAELVEELLRLHYDPLYQRSQHGHFRNFAAARVYACADLRPAEVGALAQHILTTSA